MSSRVYFHSLYKTRDYSYSSSLESPTFHFGFKGVDYRTLTHQILLRSDKFISKLKDDLRTSVVIYPQTHKLCCFKEDPYAF